MTDVRDYSKKTQREHILDRPDSYVGSVEATEYRVRVPDALTGEDGSSSGWTMKEKTLQVIPAFFKIYDEVLVNALDHCVRMATSKDTHRHVSTIKITINAEEKWIEVWNDGEGIPVEQHPEYKIYAPELIFCNLLTSSNYDDSQEKVTGGRNGFGAKLTNIYSKHFVIETVDVERKKKYLQEAWDNMTRIDPPQISASSKKKGFTRIRFYPDLERFGVSSFTPDMIQLFHRRAMDAAACTSKDVKVFYNDEKLPVKEFEAFCKLFTEDTKPVVEHPHARWSIGAVVSPDDKFEQISFVNGVNTTKGGRHVDYVLKQICEHVQEIMKKKHKVEVKSTYIREQLMIFVRSTIVNPTFDSQTKDTLTLPMSKWGSRPTVSKKFVEKLLKQGLVERVMALYEAKQSLQAKKTDGKRKKTLRGIPKLEDALRAGTKDSNKCTLYLTEGDSAATMAISGLKIIGRDHNGVFPLRGKLMNVKGQKQEAINKNQEISYLKQILGLQSGKKYKSVDDLRYGRIRILTDQDLDGSHIKGLLINMFHSEWSTLLTNTDFIDTMVTPIVKARKGKSIKSFYTLSDYNKWTESKAGNWSIKYYKGLGTSDAKEAREYFKNIRTQQYEWTDDSDAMIDVAFHKKKANLRKDWLKSYDPDRVLDYSIPKIPYETFINDDLIHFSNYDNIRSIPSMVDGLKPSQRKVLYGALKRKLTSGIRVAQLAGYVSEHTDYHHGEASLHSTIINMAQDFVNSNNMNLLSPIGQFGTRLQGGNDHASPRYIHTKLQPLTTQLFHSHDSPILNEQDADGQPIEPMYYYPVLPMILINGTQGIGTGYSTFVPCANPLVIMNDLEEKLRRGPAHEFTSQYTPWYYGYNGKIERFNDTSFLSRGVYNQTTDTTIEITELPIGTWTKEYKAFLDGLCAENKSVGSIQRKKIYLKNFEEHYNDVDVRFILYFEDESAIHQLMSTSKTDPHLTYFEKFFKLTSKISTSNMTLFNADRKLQLYKTSRDIMEDFYAIRLQAYEDRKTHRLAEMYNQLLILKSKIKFIGGIIDGSLVIQRKEDEEIKEALDAMKLYKKGKELEEGETGDMLGCYSYLLSMPMRSMTEKKRTALKGEYDSLKQGYTTLHETSIQDLWITDIQSIRTMYQESLAKKEEELRKELREAQKERMKKTKKRTTKKTTATKAKKN